MLLPSFSMSVQSPLPIVAAAAVNMLIGSLWFSPKMFGTPWMQLVGLTPDKMKTMKLTPAMAMSIMAVISLIVAGVIEWYLRYRTSDTFLEGAQAVFWVWIIVALLHASALMFEGKSKKLMLIYAAHEFASIHAMAGVIAALR